MTVYFDYIKEILSAAERLSPTSACSLPEGLEIFEMFGWSIQILRVLEGL